MQLLMSSAPPAHASWVFFWCPPFRVPLLWSIFSHSQFSTTHWIRELFLTYEDGAFESQAARSELCTVSLPVTGLCWVIHSGQQQTFVKTATMDYGFVLWLAVKLCLLISQANCSFYPETSWPTELSHLWTWLYLCHILSNGGNGWRHTV